MSEQDIKNETIDDAAKALMVQRHQQHAVDMRTAELRQDALVLIDKQDTLSANLDDMLAQAESLCLSCGLDPDGYTQMDITDGESLIQLSEEELTSTHITAYSPLESICYTPTMSWNEYLDQIGNYAQRHNVNLTGDVLTRILTKSETEELAERIREDYTLKEAHCDQYEYALAAFCGVVTGLIDVFFVGKPEDSKLGGWVDKKADSFVQSFAQKLWDEDSALRDSIKEQYRRKEISMEERDQFLKKNGIPYNQNIQKRPDSKQSCIQYLEKKFGVPYDATSSKKLLDAEGKLEGMWAGNHHMFSLAHAPDMIGLFFSILDQFAGEGTYVSGGGIIRLKAKPHKNSIDNFELQGDTFIAKLFCGVANWIGHCISDLVGSSGATGRGSGLPAPGLELFQFITASVGAGQSKISVSQLSLKVFESGYDARFYAAASIPVIMNDLLVRLCFTIKRHFYNGLSLQECIPLDVKVIRRQPELRRMLLVSQGTFCVVDFADAGIESRFEPIEFVLHLNLPAWKRLAFSGLIEIRRYFNNGALDLVRLDEDLEQEWLVLSASTPSL